MVVPPVPPLPVAATALSRFNTQTYQPSNLIIGQNAVPAPFTVDDSTYWYAVVDLTDLSVPISEASDNETQVPPNVLARAGDPNAFLFVIGNVLNGYNVPQGALYEFLVKTGSGPALAQLEQIIGQLGTGTITSFSYILAATMAQNDNPGFEAYSVTDISILTMQFLPVEVDGTWIYAPIQSAVAAPPL